MFCYLLVIVITIIFCETSSISPLEVLGGLKRETKVQDSTPPSVDLSKNQLDVECVCDLTPLACDYLCCCDSQCPDDAKKQWQNSSNNVCSDKRNNIHI